jgi:hypothetical protein
LTASKNAAVAPVVQVKAEKVVQKKEEAPVVAEEEDIDLGDIFG